MTEPFEAAGMLESLRSNPALWSMYCLQREYDSPSHDIHGRVEYLDAPEKAFETAPVSAALARQGWKPSYPNGCSWALCLTHDVDDIRVPLVHSGAWVGSGIIHGDIRTAFRGLRTVSSGTSQSPYRNFDRIMDIEDRYGAKSTFFFLARADDFHRRRYDVKELSADVRGIAARGWEVGLHVAYEGYDDASRVRDQKRIIEDVVGAEVLGARNHYLRFRTPESWWVAADAGLKYDCTLGFSDRMGFRNGMCHPFVPWDCVRGVSVPVLEMPLAVMDAVFMNGFRPKLGVDQCLNAIMSVVGEVSSCGGVLTVLWHNDTFEAPWKQGLATVYEMLLERCRDAGGWLSSAADLYRWWNRQQPT